MQCWYNKIISLMSGAKLFATQGGPVVLIQVENELNYKTIFPEDEPWGVRATHP
jgi:hypothetical protein